MKANSTLKIVLLIALVVVAAAGYMNFSKKDVAPEVSFMTLGGETLTTNQLRGKVVLVNFWATTCATCVAEMPKLADTYNRFKDKGYETIAVAMNYDPPNYVLAFAEKNQLPFKVALDAKNEVASGFGGVRLTPTSVLLDKQGRIVQRYLGEPDFAKLHALVEKLLAEPA